MATDVRLDEGSNQSWVTVEAAALNVTGADLLLADAARKKTPDGFRRALVHNESDGLTMNYDGDYPGGVRIIDARVNVHCLQLHGPVKLPKDGGIGELVATRNTGDGAVQAGGNDAVTLWLCIGPAEGAVLHGGGVSWLPIATGQSVTGTE